MRWVRRLGGPFTFVFVAALTLELCSFALSKLELLPFHDPPSAYLKNGGSGNVWRTENSDWGAWHKPNATAIHAGSCFVARYRSNEVGARDDSFASLAEGRRRYVLIGDSFAEGYAAEKQDSAEHHLEKMLDADVLNFGSSGNFGPVQYKILYDRLIRNYRFDEAILFFLPANDFKDNDFEQHRNERGASIRWRPYYRETAEGGYTEFYPEHAVRRESWVPNTLGHRMLSFASRYLWTTNVYLTAEAVRVNKVGGETPRKKYAGYFDSTVAQQRAALYYMEELVAEIAPKRATLVVIPSRPDLKRLKAGHDYRQQYWYTRLEELARQYRNLRVIDLAGFRDLPVDRMFLSCEDHWSREGNEWAARHIAEALRPPPTAAPTR